LHNLLHHLGLAHRVHLSIKNLDGHDPRLHTLRNQDAFTGCLRPEALASKHINAGPKRKKPA
ncbi:hypothetical protein, partial [Paraburkholderia sp. UCT31]|uniref:hypothetical protein n=1 Tax=Paraburkholderia sp. UCT31 TaxID=2615209 RepID=UPI001CA3C1BD